MKFHKITTSFKGLEASLKNKCKITVCRNRNSNYYIVRIERYQALIVSSEATNVLLALKKANDAYLGIFENEYYLYSSKEVRPLDKLILCGRRLEITYTHTGFFKGEIKTLSDHDLISQISKPLNVLIDELNIQASRYSY